MSRIIYFYFYFEQYRHYFCISFVHILSVKNEKNYSVAM